MYNEVYGFKGLEKKYGIKVCDDSYYNPLGRLVKRYKMYAADGCSWENGLTRDGVKKECERWADALISIKKDCGRRKVK